MKTAVLSLYSFD